MKKGKEILCCSDLDRSLSQNSAEQSPMFFHRVRAVKELMVDAFLARFGETQTTESRCNTWNDLSCRRRIGIREYPRDEVRQGKTKSPRHFSPLTKRNASHGSAQIFFVTRSQILWMGHLFWGQGPTSCSKTKHKNLHTPSRFVVVVIYLLYFLLTPYGEYLALSYEFCGNTRIMTSSFHH